MYPGKIRTPSEPLLEVVKEETILFSLDNGETPKENESAAYKNVQVKLENKGKIELFQKCTNETGLLTSADHIDPSCRCPLLMRRQQDTLPPPCLNKMYHMLPAVVSQYADQKTEPTTRTKT